MNERVGLFGGSFDPVHNGHLIVARAVAEALRLDRVVLLPSATPPHKQAALLAPADHRAAMVRLAIAGNALFELSDYDLTRTGPSYTVDTVAHFRDHLGSEAALFWIIGADSLADLMSWRDVPRILDLCEIVTACRSVSESADWAGLEAKLGSDRVERLRRYQINTPTVDIAATELRQRVAEGKSIRYFVPDAVMDYITQHKLYRDAATPVVRQHR